MEYKVNGKLKDHDNLNEEFDDRLKILEREMRENSMQKSSKIVPKFAEKHSRSSILIPQPPNLDAVYKRMSEIDEKLESIRATMTGLDQRFRRDIVTLTAQKAEKNIVDAMKEELNSLKAKLEIMEEDQNQYKSTSEKRFLEIEDNRLVFCEGKVRFHSEIITLNTCRIEKLEQLSDSFERKLKQAQGAKNIDLTVFDDFHAKHDTMQRTLKETRAHLASSIKEIREILFTKADDEAITDLENKVLMKLNELAENICKKFADKTETKIGFKNVNTQIRELFNVLLTMPKDTQKGEEDDAMLSKKPLGGFSCAS